MSKEGFTGDSSSVEQLYQKERYYLIGVALTNGAPPDDAEDFAQDAWLGVLERDNFDWSINPRGYLATSVHNRTMSYHRQNKAHPIVSLTPDDSDQSSSSGKAVQPVDLLTTIANKMESVESQIISSLDLETVMKALPPVDQTILWLTGYGLTDKEIAAEVGISHGAIRNRKNRARNKVQPHLRDSH